MTRIVAKSIAPIFCLLLIAGCFGDSRELSGSSGTIPPIGGTPPGGAKYNVNIRRTSFGIPHLKGDDYGDMGYGYGYVNAQDNLCVIADELMTIRGERSKYYGPDGSHYIVSNGTVVSNRESDFFFRFLVTEADLTNLIVNSDPAAIAATEGYAAGYSRYVRELKAGQHPGRHLDCKDAEWVHEILPKEIYSRYYRLAIVASSSVFRDGIANAAPPVGSKSAVTGNTGGKTEAQLEAIRNIPKSEFPLADGLPIGSNMYAIGPEGSADGSNFLFGNPHFPWTGPERLYQAHFILPDTEIMGAALYGVPAALIGFNEHFAWSHTVSTAYRFTFFELTLDPADPTAYMLDGVSTPMTRDDVTIEVLQPDDSIANETRTLFKSEYGPMMVLNVSGVNVLDWTTSKAYTLRDANAENDRLFNQFFRWNTAKSFEEFVELHGSVLGVPWVNTIATGPGKPVYYGDVTVVPNVPDAKLTTCGAEPINSTVQSLVPGLPTLDGSRAACNWDTDPDAPAPGIFGPANLPTLTRNDWVTNCNDSYWLSNPAEPVTGFAGIIGDEETARTLRTRLCLNQAVRRIAGTDGLADTKFTYEQLKEIVLDSQVYSAQIARDDVVASTYCSTGTATGSNGPLDVSLACTVLSAWDMKNNLESVGGHVWREFWREVNGIDNPTLWTTPFSAADPANTPAGLNVELPEVQQAFADGVQRVLNSSFALDTAFGAIQHSGIHEAFIPIFGGEGFEGSFTISASRNVGTGTSSGLNPAEGYEITYGNSFIQAVTWAPDGTPHAEGFVTYSQSTDPGSPYYSDLTTAYSAKQWVDYPFTEAQISADMVLENYDISE